MFNENLKQIKEELKKQIDFSRIDLEDAFQVHFGVCGYIRNKYLWCNREFGKKLMAYYKVKDIDTVSHKILGEVLEEIKKGR